MSSTPPVCLSVAGSDSGGGAGIQADLKAFTYTGVHGCTAITSLTAQNSRGVQGIEPVDAEFLRKQVHAVSDDVELAATKTGMLHNEQIIRVVLQERAHLSKLVVDPVMVAETGDPLLEPEAEQTFVHQLLPVADVITPNAREADIILDYIDLDTASPQQTARKIAGELDGPVVLLKGGHTDDSTARDYLARPDGRLTTVEADRIDTRNTHGTGCTLSSLIAGYLAHDQPIDEAIQQAKHDITEAIEQGYAPGEGDYGTVNLFDI